MKNIYKDILFGVAIGDALGVPVEFKSRQTIMKNPVIDMIGYGTYNLPAGTFSDDSSLTFCLAEALTKNFSLEEIGKNFIYWRDHCFWTARGEVFDIGIATDQAITRLKNNCLPELAGGFNVSDNGNGSLMRILPLTIYLKDKSIAKRYEITKQVSSITHGHIRSVIACFYYLEFALQIIKGIDKFKIYQNLKIDLVSFLNSIEINQEEIDVFYRLLKWDIFDLPEQEIYSSGYVLHTLEASIWSLLTTESYQEATLKAVNLGEDSDTTGAVTGGLAGLLYGYKNIPNNWMDKIAKKNEISFLAERIRVFENKKAHSN